MVKDIGGDCRRQEMGVSVKVYVLVMLFGSCSWLSVNSVWLEMPLMVLEQPEAWNLPSYLAVIVQLAIVGPIAFAVIKRFCKPFDHAPVIATLIAFGCLVTLLFAFLWDKTSFVAGHYRSSSLFALFFCLSLVDCTSNVMFLPYMAFFKPAYMTAYFIGMGLSALVPSLFALIQGAARVVCVAANISQNSTHMQAVSKPARFTVCVFNLVMFAWMCLALVSFIMLRWSKVALTERVLSEGISQSSSAFNKEEVNASNNNGNEVPPKIDNQSNGRDGSNGGTSSSALSLWAYLLLLCLTAWVCALMNGILPSIQSYASIPYGQTTYHLSVVLSNMANPVACFIPFFIQLKRPYTVIFVWTAVATVLAGYIMALAVLSPKALYVTAHIGHILCVAAWILAFGILAYLRTAMAGILRQAAGDSQKRLFWCGAATQAGSFIGAFVMFPLINFSGIFVSGSFCQQK